MKGKMAIIGDGDSVLVFSAVGIDVYPAGLNDDVGSLLKKLSNKYQIIYITDVLAKAFDNVIKKYLNSPYPIIVPIPSKFGNNGYGQELIKNAMDKALGVDIFVNENNNEDGR